MDKEVAWEEGKEEGEGRTPIEEGSSRGRGKKIDEEGRRAKGRGGRR